MTKWVLLAMALAIASCAPSRDPTALIDGHTIDGELGSKEAMYELRRNSVDPIMIYGDVVVAYVSLSAETKRYAVVAGKQEIDEFLYEAERKRVPIHVVELQQGYGHIGIITIAFLGIGLLGFLAVRLWLTKDKGRT